MCSIGEDDFGDEGATHAMQPSQRTTKATTTGSCKKCNTENVVVYKLFFRDFECRDCFLANARHKFRATLGSSKVLPRDASVLLIFDGSAESIVLLDMLYYAQTQKTFKRLHCNTRVLYIDESFFFEDEKRSVELITAVHNHLKAYPEFMNFITTIASNSSTFTNLDFNDIQRYFEIKKEVEAEFRKRLDSISSLTSRQDFIKYHRSNLIANVAKKLKCDFVFQSDISSSLATQLLTSMALGRGSSAAYDVALVDNRLPHNIKVIRPLRDLCQPEIEIYLLAQGLSPLKKKNESYGVSRGSAASLQNLTNAFVKNLQDNYSSTVSTVFRTCDKIAPKRDLILNDSTNVDFEAICSFCGSPYEISSCNTLLAIEFSRLVSEKGASLNKSTDLHRIASENLKSKLEGTQICHACEKIQKDSKIDIFECST